MGRLATLTEGLRGKRGWDGHNADTAVRREDLFILLFLFVFSFPAFTEGYCAIPGQPERQFPINPGPP